MGNAQCMKSGINKILCMYMTYCMKVVDFFTYDEFITRFNVNCRNYRYMSIIDAIPQNWN